MTNIVTAYRKRFAAEQAEPAPARIPDRPRPLYPAPATDAAFHALEALPSYWRGRAMGRLQIADAMDLTRDTLADHQAVAEYERRAKEAA